MNNPAEFSIPKDRVRVTLRLRSDADINGDVFLEHLPGERALYQKVAALLENEYAFLPVLEEGSGQMQFVNKRSIKAVEFTGHDEQAEQSEEFRLLHVEHIEAVFIDGDSMQGALAADVPAQKARLSDCLNLRERFLCMKRGGSIWFVNKESIQQVRYADAPSAGTGTEERSR